MKTSACICWPTYRVSFPRETQERSQKNFQRFRGIRPTTRNFDSTYPVQLVQLLKGIRITLNEQHLNKGVVVRFLEYFLELNEEHLNTKYSMRSLRIGQLHEDTGWARHENQFIKRYVLEKMLGETYDTVATEQQRLQDANNSFAERSDSAVYRCTSVLSNQSLAR